MLLDVVTTALGGVLGVIIGWIVGMSLLPPWDYLNKKKKPFAKPRSVVDKDNND